MAGDAGVVAQFLNELFAGFRAHVGKQEGVFDVLPVGFGKLILRKNVEQSLAERIARLGQARLEALHAGAGGFRGFDGRNGYVFSRFRFGRHGFDRLGFDRLGRLGYDRFRRSRLVFYWRFAFRRFGFSRFAFS